MIVAGLLVALAFAAFFVAWRCVSRAQYKSGTGWCAMRWTFTDSGYITRLHVVKTPWFAVCLHWINHPDPEPHLHDHPVTFLSLVLRGWYSEERERGRWYGMYMRRWWNFIRATPEDRHQIIRCKPGTLTLCFMGPKTREWGFHTETGWVHWKTYHHAQRAERAAEKATMR